MAFFRTNRDRTRDAMRLLKANETNMYALTPFYYNWPRATKHEGEELSWCVTDIPFPWCNVAFNARLDPACADRAIHDFAEAGRERNVPVCWWISSETKPVDMAGRLKKHGFVKRGDTSLMAVDLHSIREGRLPPHGLTIEQVEDRDGLRLWCSVAAAGFAIPPPVEPFLFEWLSIAVDLGLPLRFYLARMRGLPVATSILFLVEGTAGLYFISTAPAARREGIGHAITVAPLREARRLGYGVGVLQASRMGEALYRRIGFRVYGTMTSYIRMHDVLR